MTGVTAMSRDFAVAMDTNGVLFPAEKIKDWFATSDIVHISNEVSFWKDCPPQPTVNRSVFCSDPKYWELLTSIGTNVIELTGNHLNDYGWEPLSYTLGIYERRRSYLGADAPLPKRRASSPNQMATSGVRRV
jgi:poly-gamma-glutamate synthesis protein (capsule biosynthesis protein)